MLDFVNGAVRIYCGNQKFVESFLADKEWDTYKHRDMDYWYFANLITHK